MIDKQAYMLRISQAGPAQMVVINFEIIIDYLGSAKKIAIAATTSEHMDDFRADIQKAKNGLDELIASLNLETPLALGFYEIYKYIYKRISDVHYTLDTKKAIEALNEVLELLNTLLIGWQETAKKEPQEEPQGGNAPKVYAGLTYSKNGQANEYVEESSGRDYMA